MTESTTSFTRKGSTADFEELRTLKKDARNEACRGYSDVLGEDADLIDGRDVFFEGYRLGDELLLSAHIAYEGKDVVRRLLVSVDPTPGEADQALIRAAYGVGRLFGERQQADPEAFFFFSGDTDWAGPVAVPDDERFHFFDEAMPEELAFHWRFLDVDSARHYADWIYEVEFGE